MEYVRKYTDTNTYSVLRYGSVDRSCTSPCCSFSYFENTFTRQRLYGSDQPRMLHLPECPVYCFLYCLRNYRSSRVDIRQSHTSSHAGDGLTGCTPLPSTFSWRTAGVRCHRSSANMPRSCQVGQLLSFRCRAGVTGEPTQDSLSIAKYQ